MVAIDYIFLFLLTIPFAYGLYKGLIRMVISALALYFGFIFARQYSGDIADSLSAWIEFGQAGRIVIFFICFAFVVFVFSMIARIVRAGIMGANLGCVDRLLGGLLGSLVGLAISFGLVFFIFTYLPEPDQYLKDSRLSPKIVESGTYFLLMIPPWMEEEIQEEYEKLRKIWKSDVKEKGKVTLRYRNESGSPRVLDRIAILAVSSTTSARYIAS